MSLSLKNFALAAVAAATLVACGGGGGSTSSNAPTFFSVSGQAAKGALVGALVVAETFKDGKWVPVDMKPQAGAITKADGSFDLEYAKPDTPVRLIVKHQEGATMYNEVTGKSDTPMPASLTLSSFVVNHAKNNINAYTQFAFDAAGGQYDGTTIAAANAVARAVAGASDPVHELETGPDTTYAIRMAAMLGKHGVKDQEDCDKDCVKSAVESAMDALGASAANLLIAVDGRVTFDSTKLDTLHKNLESLGISPSTDTSFLVNELTSINFTENQASFDQFVKNLRGSFLQLKDNWNSSDQTLQQRYSDLTTHGTMSIAASVKDMLENCVFWDGETNAACFDEEGWSTNDGGKTYTKSYTNPQGIDMLVTASGTHTSSSFNMRYVAEQKKDGVAFEKADLVLSGSGVNASAEDIGQMVVGQSVKMMLNGTIEKVGVGSANKTTVTIKDMGVEVSGVKLREADSGNVHLDANDSTMKLQGDVGFSSNFGDTAKGLVSATILNKVVGTADDTVPVVQKLDASLEITPKDAALQSAKLSLSGNFTPAEASSNGFAVVNLNAYAKVNNGDVVKFDLSRTAADKATASLTVGVGSDAIVAKVEAVQTQIGAAQALPDYCFDVEQKLFCAKDLNLSSSDGKFKAVVNADTLQGDLTHNGTKFGEISKSGITFDGKKYSFY